MVWNVYHKLMYLMLSHMLMVLFEKGYGKTKTTRSNIICDTHAQCRSRARKKRRHLGNYMESHVVGIKH